MNRSLQLPNKCRCILTRSLRLTSSVKNKTTAADVEQHFSNAEKELSFPIPFSTAKLGPFTQEEPELRNQYLEDPLLKSYVRRHVPQKILADIEPDIIRFGERVGSEMYHLHNQCEAEKPYLEKYTGWGKKVDKLVTGPAWRKMHDIAAEEGLVSIAYERKYGEWSRLYSMVKLYLYSPSSGLYSCPLAMTDGAAKIVETFKDSSPWLYERAFPRLISRSPSEFWTSGQWMTEKRGGSDVANGTETLAIPQPDGTYKLHGYKWFSSATDADMTFTLARVIGQDGTMIQGTKGLALFYLEVKNKDGSLNNMEMIQLKNKLGTRQLPTAELLLDGSVAYKVSEDGRGVPSISDMLKLTRLHNTIAASSAMRRLLNLSKDYSTKRRAFGNLLKDYPLHVQTLARMEVETRAALILGLENARLLGREDVGMATTEEEHLLRLMVPLAKLYSGKQAMAVGTEGLETFGGQGYIEDTGLPAIVRDAQVLSIWEGTTNILSLDVLRAIAKSNGEVLHAFHSETNKRLSEVKNPNLLNAAKKVKQSADEIMTFMKDNMGHGDLLQTAARDFAYSLCRTYTGALLIDHACSHVGSEMDTYVAQRWCEQDLTPVVTNLKHNHYNKDAESQNYNLVYEGMAKL